METLRLGVFDVDGTIRKKEGVPQEVKDGFKHLWKGNVLTTVLTGRGHARLKEMLGADWTTVISPVIPVGLENGGRISNQEGTQNVRYFPLNGSEIASTLDVIRKGEVQFLAYFPEDPRQRATLWTPNQNLVTGLQESYGHFAEISNDPLNVLNKRLQEERPCMLAIKPESFEMRNDFPEGTNVVYNEGVLNLMGEGITKGKGVTEIADILGIDISEVIVAGNEENDLPMLKLPVTRKYFVGPPVFGMVSVPENLISVATPEAFGQTLQTLSFEKK